MGRPLPTWEAAPMPSLSIGSIDDPPDVPPRSGGFSFSTPGARRAQTFANPLDQCTAPAYLRVSERGTALLRCPIL